MKLIAPDYYGSFRCIADKCRHNCCIGWQIDIDDDTYRYYCSLPGEFGVRLREGIDHAQIPMFKMDSRERCVFLGEDGLCEIISRLGEGALCEICTDHPRFRNFFSDRVEIGLGLCCEEACRLILENTDKVTLNVLKSTGDDAPEEEEKAFFLERSRVLKILQDRSLAYSDRVNELRRQYDLRDDGRTPYEWAQVYRALERLDIEWDACLDALAERGRFDVQCDDTVCEQLAVYFVYRHLSQEPSQFRCRLAFCLHAVSMICAVSSASGVDIKETARMYSGEIEYSDVNTDALMAMME